MRVYRLTAEGIGVSFETKQEPPIGTVTSVAYAKPKPGSYLTVAPITIDGITIEGMAVHVSREKIILD